MTLYTLGVFGEVNDFAFIFFGRPIERSSPIINVSWNDASRFFFLLPPLEPGKLGYPGMIGGGGIGDGYHLGDGGALGGDEGYTGVLGGL